MVLPLYDLTPFRSSTTSIGNCSCRRLPISGCFMPERSNIWGLNSALWKSSQMVHLRHHPLLAVAGVLAALALVAALAVLYRSRPNLLAVCAVIALPFRFSLLSGGTGGVLLVLYVVIGAGALALVIWGEQREEPPVGLLERVLEVGRAGWR